MKTYRPLKMGFFYGWFSRRKRGRPAVFISHSSQDREQAALLVSLLRAAFCLPAPAIRCTSLEGYRLPCGADMDEMLKREVRDCRVLIAIVSESSARSAYMTFQLGTRWGCSRPLLPLLVSSKGAALLQGPLSHYNALSARSLAQLTS